MAQPVECGKVGKKIKGFFSKIGNGLKTAVKAVGGAISTVAKKVVGGIGKGVKAVANFAVNHIPGVKQVYQLGKKIMNLPGLKQIGGAIKSVGQLAVRLNPISMVGNQFERFKLMAEGKWKDVGKSFGKDALDIAQGAAIVGTGGAAGGALALAKSVGMNIAKDIGKNSVRNVVMDLVKRPNLNKVNSYQSNPQTAIHNMGGVKLPTSYPRFMPSNQQPLSNFRFNAPEYSGPRNLGIPAQNPSYAPQQRSMYNQPSFGYNSNVENMNSPQRYMYPRTGPMYNPGDRLSNRKR